MVQLPKELCLEITKWILNGHSVASFATDIEARYKRALSKGATFLGPLVFTKLEGNLWCCEHILNGWGFYLSETFESKNCLGSKLKEDLLLHLQHQAVNLQRSIDLINKQ